MKKTILLSLLLAVGAFSFAQTTILEENPGSPGEEPKDGPNLKNFQHFYVGYGLVDAIKEDYADFQFGKSNELVFGQRKKLKLTEWYSIGGESELVLTNFHVNPDSSAFLSPKKELIRMTQLGGAFYNRFNFGKRGNRIGSFFQIGIYGQWVINSKLIVHQDAPSAKQIRTRTVNPDYINRWNYGLNAAIGFNRYVFTARYRLSDAFNTSKNPLYQNMPPIVFGVQIGIHK